jgi:hypothetical protein
MIVPLYDAIIITNRRKTFTTYYLGVYYKLYQTYSFNKIINLLNYIILLPSIDF